MRAKIEINLKIHAEIPDGAGWTAEDQGTEGLVAGGGFEPPTFGL